MVSVYLRQINLAIVSHLILAEAELTSIISAVHGQESHIRSILLIIIVMTLSLLI